MAEGVPFKEANAVMKGGEGVNDLDVALIQHPCGTRVIVSCWQLTKPEIDEIVRTGKVWLYIMGQSMPPVCISSERPFAPD